MKKLMLILVLLLPFAITYDRALPKEQKVMILNASSNNSLYEAYDYINKTVNELLDGLDFSALESEFSGFEFNNMSGDIKSIISSLITGDYNVDGKTLINQLLSQFLGGLGDMSVYFAVLLAIAVLTALLDAVKPSFMDKSLTDLAHFVSFVVVIGIVGGLFVSVYTSAVSAVESLEKQVDAVFPLLLTLMTASGGSVSVAVFEPQVAFLTKGMNYVVKTVLLPIVLLLFLFTAVGHLTDKFSLDKTKKFLQSAFKWITGLTAVIFNFFVTTQGLTASIYDGVSIKALKYTLGNSIPLVGSLISGGFDVVMASMILIKNAVGSLALLALIYTVLAPIIKIAVFTLFLRFVSAVIEPICDRRLSGLLSGVADVAGYITTTTVVGASSYFITVLLFICSLGGVV